MGRILVLYKWGMILIILWNGHLGGMGILVEWASCPLSIMQVEWASCPLSIFSLPDSVSLRSIPIPFFEQKTPTKCHPL